MNSDGTIIYYDNDGESDYNAKINCYLEAGEVIYIISRVYNQNIFGNYFLVIN